MKIKQLHEDAILPRYSTEGSSAFDLFTPHNVECFVNQQGQQQGDGHAAQGRQHGDAIGDP